MPTYDYKCDACGHDMEVFQSITASPLKKCPKCGRNALKRLIGAGAGLIFKGSGFYCTDYRKGGSTPSSSSSPSCKNCPKAESSGGECKSGGDGKTED